MIDNNIAGSLKVCVLWHMHQPDYRDPISRQTLLPWTWLHALKDYGEMLETVVEVKTPVTVNMVPSLLEQLERYQDGEDRDYWLELIRRNPAEFSAEERVFCVEQLFSVNEGSHIFPNPRYQELFLLRGNNAAEAVHRYTNDDLRDLQVWFLLAWTGYHLRRRTPLIGALLDQGRQFSEEQKSQLLRHCDAEVGRVLALHRQLEQEGLIEISVTPYAHPILPLLCDLHCAREPSPGLPLPAVDFRYPEDARLQVREGLRTAERIFGERPRGMWPAEGAVSEAAVNILASEGAQWAATDEDILARSLDGGLSDRNRLYQVYSYAGLPLLFRDREISDRIGFLYAAWNGQEAVHDLMQRLQDIARRVPDGTVAIILDGENCWERYPDNGYPFLRNFYQQLEKTPGIAPVTISTALEYSTPIPLNRLAAGSWIRSDFTTWIGHPEENLAWELLHQARRDLFSQQVHYALEHPEEPLSELVRELLRAEGSDWFWWYGDEHSTAQADIFDRLFRLHLDGLYHMSGQTTPDALMKAIKPVATMKSSGYEPTACFTPIIDGKVSDYFEWLAKGCIDLSVGGAMYSSREGLKQLYYGYDSDNLYFCLDQIAALGQIYAGDHAFEIRLTAQSAFCLRFAPADNTLTLFCGEHKVGAGVAAIEQVVEMAIPLDALGVKPGDMVQLSCHLFSDGREAGRWPSEGSASFCYRGAVLDEENWLV